MEGFILTGGKKIYGHSARGTPCVAVTKFHTKTHFTVSLIVGVSGVKYVKIVEGSSNSVDFLQFLGEAGNSYTFNGENYFKEETASL